MKALTLLAVLLVVPAIAASAEERPRRVVSMNTCVDQFLVALADKDQIAALSNYSRDPGLSYFAQAAEAWPQTRGSVEEVLALRPDLVIAGTSRRQGAVAQLRKQGLRIVEVRPADGYPAIIAEIREIAALLGQTERGETMIAQMDAALAAIPAPPAPKPVAAYYARRGYLSGTRSLINDMMNRAGFVNLAEKLGRKTVTQMPLEMLVQAKPDYLIMDTDADPNTDLGSAMLFHPALAAVVPRQRWLGLPRAMTTCGGPFFPQAVERLAAQRSPS